MAKTLDTKKLIATFKTEHSRSVHYKPFNDAGYICNGYIGVAIYDHETWKKLMLQLGAEAEKGRIKLYEDPDLDSTLSRFSDTATHPALNTGVSVSKNKRTVDIFESNGDAIALDHKFTAALGDYTRAMSTTGSNGPVVFLGHQYWALIMPVMPRVIEAQIQRVLELMR